MHNKLVVTNLCGFKDQSDATLILFENHFLVEEGTVNAMDAFSTYF